MRHACSAASCLAAVLPFATAVVHADVVTGTVSPAGAKVVIVDSKGAEVATLPAGPYQLQLPVGKFKARCVEPTAKEQEFLSLSGPVTVNIACE
jgi:phosphate-selective porin